MTAAPTTPAVRGAERYARARLFARLAAVQALYQMEVSGRGAGAVVQEFLDHRFAPVPPSSDEMADPSAIEDDADDRVPELILAEEALLDPVDRAHFRALVEGAVLFQEDLDAAIGAHLAKTWKLARLDATARAILRAGAFEVTRRPDVPPAVAIDAYVDVANAFFDGPEPGFINACLDAIARAHRS